MCTSSLSQHEDLPEVYGSEGSAESRLGCMSLLEIYTGLLAGCYIQQKSGTLPQHQAVIGIGFRVWLIQNTVLLHVQGCKLDAVLVDSSNSCS